MSGGLLKRLSTNSSRVHLYQHNKDFAQTVPAGSLILDAGAGEAPYKELFKHTRYESADFEKVNKPYAQSTYVCDLASIPVGDGRFDAVVFNQVLEHIPEPKNVLIELNRVMKKGGRIICTTPLFYEEHEKPYDYFRYTQFGHQYLFKAAGFEIESIKWMEGYFGTVAYQLETAAKYLPVSPKHIAPGLLGYVLSPFVAALKKVFSVIAVIFYRLDVKNRYCEKGFPKNYVVIATKA